jgi:hypothetical protein
MADPLEPGVPTHRYDMASRTQAGRADGGDAQASYGLKRASAGSSHSAPSRLSPQVRASDQTIALGLEVARRPGSVRDSTSW